jgi:hypothetical protein
MTEGLPPTSRLWSPPSGDPLVQLDDHETRILALEAAIYGVTVAPFTAPGAWPPTSFAPRYHVEHGYDVMQVRMSCGFGPDNGGCTGSVWVNETDVLAQLTIPDGENTVFVDLAGAVSLAGGDYLTVTIDDSPGTEADWTWQIRMIRAE